MVRTRIAPSPTGFPHIGTMYQALFDYAYAKRMGGSFIIRIEDTDQARLVAGAEDAIYKAFDWFGFIEDESPRKGGECGPYRQSERLDLYMKHALELVEQGHAYYCFCSKERLESVRKDRQAQKLPPMYDKFCRSLLRTETDEKLASGVPWVIRLKVPEDTTISVQDLIRGEITFQSEMVDDQVLIKSDGFPTYHLAVVVDDHLMKVTHIVRGEEWIPSAPKHVLLYDYFEWEKPVFFHTPILRNPDKSKFSKRHGHTNVSWYRERGFLPEAILNYMALMGWSHPEGKDIFSLEEFISLFDLADVKPVGPIFDLKKLEWLNGQYIMKLSQDELFKELHTFYHDIYNKEILRKSIPLVQERIKTFSEYAALAGFLYEEPQEYEQKLSEYKPLIGKMKSQLEKIDTWNADTIGEAMQKCAEAEGVKNRVFFMVLRIAISGKKITPPLNESMEILGKEECLRRLQKTVTAA